MTEPEPFEVSWTEQAVAGVLDRVRAYSFPLAPAGSGWTHGCDPDFLRALCSHWSDRYSWRHAVRTLNRHPQFRAEVDGFPLHFIHVRGEAEGRRPLLLTHGWPSSTFEFSGVIDALAFPSRHGGQATDAFDLVIPSLPGFGWSGKPANLVDQRETARLFNRLMTEILGYDRYLAQGGDWGALVTASLGLHHGGHARAIALTMLFPTPAADPAVEAERRWQAEAEAVEERLGAYGHLQATRPQSLAWAMAGNPVGQAAWIVERYHDWSDLRTRPFEAVFSHDQLLTTAMIYLMEDAFATSTWYYAAAREAKTRRLAPGEFVKTPTSFTFYPDPRHPVPPRSVAARGYEVARWTEMPRGGHFPAIEVPDLWIDDLRAWAREAG